MLKKTITGIIITVLIVSMMVIPVSAARYDYNEYIVNTGVDGENDILTMSFPTELNSWYVVDIHDSSRPIRKYYGENSAVVSTSWFDDCPNDMFYMVYKPLGENALKVDNVPNGSTLSMNITIDVRTTHLESCLLDPYMRIRYYDTNGSYIGYSSAIYSEQGHIGDYWAEEVGTSGQVTFDSSTTISKPEGAVYAQFWFYIYVTPWFEPEGNRYIFEVKNGSTMTFGISSLYRLQESTGQTNEILGDINGNIEELPGEFGDVLEDQANAEKEQASQGGNSNVGEVLEVVPDKSEGFINAIKGFASSMSYTGTSAKLPVPALTVPEIPGLIPNTVLWDGMELDFEQYIDKLPNGLLLLVQSLLTIALIVYCFKELYDTIAYVMTLRKG